MSAASRVRSWRALGWAGAGLGLLAGCQAPPGLGPWQGPDPTPVGAGWLLPDREAFAEVADALQPSCGTLDCHGQQPRNLRLYGGRGLRLDPGSNPADDATTPAEYEASFRSLVALEPDALSQVLLQQGADPERLSLIRKARGSERHKGGTQALVGDPLDRCLLSWLQGSLDVQACRRVSRARRPSAED